MQSADFGNSRVRELEVLALLCVHGRLRAPRLYGTFLTNAMPGELGGLCNWIRQSRQNMCLSLQIQFNDFKQFNPTEASCPQQSREMQD